MSRQSVTVSRRGGRYRLSCAQVEWLGVRHVDSLRRVGLLTSVANPKSDSSGLGAGLTTCRYMERGVAGWPGRAWNAPAL